MQNKPVQKESGTCRHARLAVPVVVCNRPMLLFFPASSGSTLKLIAILSMLIDHAGATIIRTLWQSPVISSSVSQSRLW